MVAVVAAAGAVPAGAVVDVVADAVADVVVAEEAGLLTTVLAMDMMQHRTHSRVMSPPESQRISRVISESPWQR